MKSRKERLIEALRGSLQGMDRLPGLIARESIYDETGHVDCAFMTAILEFMSDMMTVTREVQCSLSRLLGVDDTPQAGKPAGDRAMAGERWDAAEILRHCSLEDGVLRLPSVRLDRKSYAEAKKWIEEAGGSWKGGKTQGFTFPFDPGRVFSVLSQGKRCDLRKEFQFFETPDGLADWLVSLAGGVAPGERALEPSAGRGALVRAIRRACPGAVVDCYELMPENRELLRGVDGARLLGEDFMKPGDGSLYDKVIANPPFSGNQDVRHVMAMYVRLAPGGTLAAITSPHWEFSQERECEDFRRWLAEREAEVHDVEAGAFKAEGTTVRTKAVVIRKPREGGLAQEGNGTGARTWKPRPGETGHHPG